MAVAETSPITVVHRALVTVDTDRAVQVVDLTPLVGSVIRRVGLADGLVTIATRHTTTGLVVNEHEPLLALDIVALLQRLAPPSAGYAHDDFTRRHDLAAGERVNGHAHCQAVLLAATQTLPVADGRLALGRWQRLLFVELDGAQRRQVSVTCLGLGGDSGARADP
jgi:secondary thiamine-phosphate synthase enzyme